MKIAFRIDISSEIGTGHYMRMSALADAFKEPGHDCELFRGEDEPIDYSDFDIVILDTYEVSDEYIAALNAPNRLTVCYDDNALYTYDCDVLINANLHAHELGFRFGKKIPKLLLGGKYALLRKEFRESAPITIKKKANSVFVCFGGSDARNMTPRVIKALENINGIHLHVALGAYTTNDNEVLELSGKNVSIYKNPQKITEIMSKCDIAVTAAGSMIYEVAAMGMPGIAIVQADNQILVAEYMAREGLIITAGDADSVDYIDLGDNVNMLLQDFQRRKDVSAKMVKRIDKNGAMNAAIQILEEYRFE